MKLEIIRRKCHDMNEEITSYIEKYNNDIQELFIKTQELVMQSVSCNITEKLWAKIPSFYVGERFIRIIPFKDHINVEAKAILQHISELKEYKITPKGMLQIYQKQEIPCNILQVIFIETLLDDKNIF